MKRKENKSGSVPVVKQISSSAHNSYLVYDIHTCCWGNPLSGVNSTVDKNQWLRDM